MQTLNLAPLFRVTHMEDPVVNFNMAHYKHFGHELFLKYPLKTVALFAANHEHNMFDRFCEYCACWVCNYWGNCCTKEYNWIDFVGVGAHRIGRYRIALDDIKGDARDELDTSIANMMRGEDFGSRLI